jgi:DNA-binding IclR family transcriptional regulator
LSGPILEALCEEIHETVALAVWGTHGATIVRIVDAGGPITITLRPGTVLVAVQIGNGTRIRDLLSLALSQENAGRRIRELAESSKTAVTTIRRQLEKNLTEIRSHGIARATGSLTPGINGFSAPVYDHTGSMVAAITSLGTMGEFNAEWDSPVAAAMLDAASTLSRRLGYGSLSE